MTLFNTVRPFVFVALLAAVGPEVALPQEPAHKAAIPDEDAQKAALTAIEDIYKPHFEKAKTPAQKLELAKKLLGEGIATKDDSVSRFVLFRVARDMAAKEGGLVMAFDAIGRISLEFEADRMRMQIAAAQMSVKALKTAKDHLACAALLAPLIDEAIAVDRYDHAKSLASLTGGCAKEGKDSGLIKQMASKSKDIETIAAEFEKVTDAMISLDAKQTDPAANLAVGRFLCFFKGDWGRGVPMLALGRDEHFKATALLELEEKPDALKLGDAWWKIAEGLDGTSRLQAQAHAAGWYRMAFPGLSGLSKARVERLVAQVPLTPVRSIPSTPAKPPSKISDQKDWKQIAGKYLTLDTDRKAIGPLILEVGPGAIPVMFHRNEKGDGPKTKRSKQVGNSWMFDFGNIDLFVITAQPDGKLTFSIYFAASKVAFENGKLPNRFPDRSSIYFRSDLKEK